jgi:hypothetical protein
MVTWTEFARTEPAIADAGSSLLNQFGVGLAFLATVRKDGAPRLHPVCPVLSGGRLFVLITPESPKLRDLLRDGRYALQTFPQPKPGSDEFSLAGRALLVDDAETRAAVLRDAKHMANASEIAFELWIDRAMHTRWEDVLTPRMRSVHRKWRAPRESPGRRTVPELSGCVIAESLSDPTILNRFRTYATWITDEGQPLDARGHTGRWHLQWIRCGLSDVDEIQRGLRPEAFYAHFWHGDRILVVYPDARFEIATDDKSTWTEAIRHGRAKGIPDEQLDFLTGDPVAPRST